MSQNRGDASTHKNLNARGGQKDIGREERLFNTQTDVDIFFKYMYVYIY